MRISDWSSDVCSSDLVAPNMPMAMYSMAGLVTISALGTKPASTSAISGCASAISKAKQAAMMASRLMRSEEHTSELQSLMRSSYAVFRLQQKQSSNNCMMTCTYCATIIQSYES